MRADRWTYQRDGHVLQFSHQGSVVAEIELTGDALEAWLHLTGDRLEPEITTAQVGMLTDVREMEKAD